MWSQPETATHKALNPEWPSTAQTEMLRSIELTNRILIWMRTKDAKAGRNQPTPFYWPWEDAPDDASMRGDAVSWERAEELWGRDMRARNAAHEAARLGLPDPTVDEHETFPEEI